ncbi:hypothetical protein BIV57_16650 [Mangrovactinospora gilvigrisea]|uniref:PH domain-containing protein n=1 Tax=Mangrovactinospora gilvigrisea TaxID=1428644 RepID=A0A1J7BCF7_9ACTN|nr:hypothetical protein [Mangrovactinospora gilvigrisea]OIV36355.1 hypothetical protein BIV57_16650 [Mangrovactinospora gilvigrisea]
MADATGTGTGTGTAGAGAAAAAAVPERVSAAAAQAALGRAVDARREITTGQSLVVGVLFAGGGWGLLALIAAYADDVSPFGWVHSILHVVAFGLFFFGFYGAVLAVRGLLVGNRVHYLYEGGLVNRRRSSVRVVRWAEAESLTPVHDTRQGEEGKLRGYRLRGRGGVEIPIPLQIKDGRDAFVDRIVASLRQAGCTRIG